MQPSHSRLLTIGNITSGGNTGCAIGIGDSFGPNSDVTGCTILNTTTLDVAVDGGTAISDASGGDYKLAFVSERSRGERD